MIRIPAEFQKENHTYVYQERINNRVVLYKEKNFRWNECFL